jgi:hypothetical protein
MSGPDIKVVKVKMRGMHGSAKTELLRLLANRVRGFGMQVRLEADGHNMAITSTKEQRCALWDFNRGGEPMADWPAGGRRGD